MATLESARDQAMAPGYSRGGKLPPVRHTAIYERDPRVLVMLGKGKSFSPEPRDRPASVYCGC